jgi:two-component system, NtrC family, sensor histidine kinase HydH
MPRTRNTTDKQSLVISLLQVNPRLLIGITVVLSLLLTFYAVLEIHSTRKEFSHLLQEQAHSLLSLTRKGLMDAAVSLEYVEQILTDRLFDNARFLEKMDYENRLTAAGLKELSTMNQLFRVNVFDRNGAMVLSNVAEVGRGGQGGGPRQQLQPLLRGEADEMILGLRQGRFGSSQRFAVAKARRRGGAITVNVDAQEMLAFRRTIGAGSFMRYLDSIPDIRYGVLQSREQVILGSRKVEEISTIDSEPFLQTALQDTSIHSRFIQYRNEEVLEITQSLDSGSFGRTLLRIGLSTVHMHEAEKSARQRVILQSLLFLMIGVVLSHFFFSIQNHRSLQKDYYRIKDQTSSIMANMNDAVIAMDQQGRISKFNLAAERLLEVRAPAVLGQPCAQSLAVCPWLISVWQEKKEIPYLEETFSIRGHRVVVQGSITVLRDETGQPDTVFAVLRDVTEQKRLEEHVKRQEQLNAMGHLASGVAHEIRNPLNAISMIGQRLRIEFQPAMEQEEYEMLTKTLVSESRRINDIVQQFLQFSRPAPLNKQSARLDALLQNWGTLLMPVCNAKGVQLELLCSETPAIAVDADKLQQAIWNLAQNSLDACRAGDRLTISCETVQEKIRITIKDTGHGISAQDLPKIFHLYFTTREKGTGLGLAIVQQIIAQHDGVITVDSRPGQGTTFIIELG